MNFEFCLEKALNSEDSEESLEHLATDHKSVFSESASDQNCFGSRFEMLLTMCDERVNRSSVNKVRK